MRAGGAKVLHPIQAQNQPAVQDLELAGTPYSGEYLGDELRDALLEVVGSTWSSIRRSWVSLHTSCCRPYTERRFCRWKTV